MITLMVGSTGAGKTTYARKMAQADSSIVYSIDNWMKDLFGQDMPADPKPEWFYENQKWYVERISRCEELIKKITLDRARINQKSILDLGFSTKEHRAQFIQYFKSHNVPVQIQFLDIPVETRRDRVNLRNESKGETFVMTVDDSLFNYMESIFEAPTANEGVEVKTISDN